MRDALPLTHLSVRSIALRIAISLLILSSVGWEANAQTSPAFVQANQSTPTTSASIVAVPFATMQSPGDLNVVVVGWHDSNVDIQSVVDANGNTYVLAAGPGVYPNIATQSVYYAPNVAAATPNTVTVTFTGPAAWADVRIAEYSGVDRAAPVEATAAGQGSSGPSDSGPLTTTSANALLVAANIVQTVVTSAGPGFIQRGTTLPSTNVLEDRVVSPGTYNATAAVAPDVPWIMQLVAFRAATTADVEAPTAPGTLTATAVSSSQIDLSWVASTDNVGVTNYLIERCQDPGCTSFTQITTSATSYSDAGLSGSTTYNYRVRATDAANNLSVYSNTATATTLTPPDTQAPTAPTALTATAASGTAINLSWTASTDNVGVTNYLIERCLGAGCTTFAQVATSATTSFADSGLTNATAYRYQLRATDAAGNLSAYSNIATATTPDTQPPTAPATLTATAASGTAINLSWAASTDNVGVTNYLIERCLGAGCTTFAQVATSATTGFGDSGLTNATAYRYRVRATDAAGNLSAYSNIATATTPDTQPPTAPATLTATAASGTAINLSWTASTDNVAVTNYLVERCLGAACATFAQVGTSATTNFADSGLSNATAYRYQVRATDAGGNLSAYSNIAAAMTTDTQAPTAPTTLTATAASGTSINLSWTASTDNVAVTNYLVERCLGAACTTFAQVGTSAPTNFADSGLTNATAYRYQVRATDAGGNLSAYSNIAAATTTDTQAPTAPTTLTATAASGTAINLSWTTSTDNVAVTNYLIERCLGASCTTFAQVATSATTSFADSGLTNATTYGYRVRATDAASNLSGYSNIATAATPDTQPPSTPGSLTATATSSNQVSLTWTGSSDNVGVTGYRISRGGTLLTTVTTLTYVDSGLSPNTLYNYTVVAVDAAGNPSAPASASVTTPASTGTIVLASDNFNRANGVPGTGWTVIDSDPRIVSQHILETNAKDGNDSIAIYTGVTWPADQYSQISVLAATQHSGASVIVRAKNDPVIEMYFVYVTGPLGAGARLTLAKFVTHVYAELWTSIVPVNAGDTLYLGVQGTTLTVKLNGNTLTTQTDGSITAPGFSGFDVTDYDGQGNAGDGQLDNWVGGTFDTSGAITAPTNVQSTTVTSTEIDLSWTASTATAGVAGYNVLRNGTQVGTSATTAFADPGLNQSTTYTYTVVAFDTNGVTSAPSTPVAITTQPGGGGPDVIPPTVPSGLASSTLSPTTASLTWTASTDNVGVTGYKIFRNGSQVSTSSVPSFSDSGLTPATSYTYTVSAVDAAGNESAQSQPLTVTTASTPPPNGPVLAWSFDEGTGTVANDASGHGHPGTLVNGPVWSTGHSGSAVTFDGINDYVTAGNVTALNGLSAVTVSAWVKGAVGASSPDGIIAGKDAAFSLIVEGHKAKFGIKSSGQWFGFQASTTSVDDGTYHFLTGVFDGTTVRIYVDGVQQATTAVGTRTLDSPSTSVEVASCIGGPNCGGSGEMWQGVIDDLRIYDRALSQTEIQTDRDTPVAPPDQIPPSIPANVAGSATSSSSISLTWTASTDNVAVTGYRIFRNATSVGTSSTTSFADSGLNPSTTYTYAVAAFDASGNTSNVSAATNVTTLADTTAPSVPTNVAGTSSAPSQINLSWTVSTDNVAVTGYNVLRNGVSIGTSATNSFADTGLTAATTYSYAVSAFDGAGNTSASSTPVNVTTLPLVDSVPPSAPTGVAGAANSQTQISITWTASTDNVGVTGYKIFRNGSQVGTSSVLSFADTGLTAGTTYRSAVSAFNQAGNNSALSSPPLSVTTMSTPPPGAPVAAYSFNEGTGTTTADASGNSHPGTLINGPAWAAGHAGSAVNYDGVNDYVSAGNIAAVNGLTAVTVSAWVKGSVGASSPDAVIVGKDMAFALVVYTHKAQFGVKSGNSWLGFPSSTTSVDDGNFHFLTGVYDGTTVRIYVDGVQQGSQNIGARTLNSPTTNLEFASCIGGPNCDGSGEMWRGIIDDVRVYNRALSASEILADMSTPVVP